MAVSPSAMLRRDLLVRPESQLPAGRQGGLCRSYAPAAALRRGGGTNWGAVAAVVARFRELPARTCI
ncbi:hypothetical protein [Fodinicola feengrottensis]|uniref:hypothetical protein n=1 Tax=Fodinicola feengrottensis TaxID=435914 RepID=UPI0013D468E2|nr:hypothetical protein [Fodinicola feengrottensis]